MDEDKAWCQKCKKRVIEHRGNRFLYVKNGEDIVICVECVNVNNYGSS